MVDIMGPFCHEHWDCIICHASAGATVVGVFMDCGWHQHFLQHRFLDTVEPSAFFFMDFLYLVFVVGGHRFWTYGIQSIYYKSRHFIIPRYHIYKGNGCIHRAPSILSAFVSTSCVEKYNIIFCFTSEGRARHYSNSVSPIICGR